MGIAIALALAGVACAAYELKFQLSETKMRFHYFWFFLAVVLVTPAVLMATGLWDGIPPAVRAVPAVALLLFVAYEAVVGTAIARHYHDKAAPDLDYVVVLGAQVLDGKPGRTFSRRLDAAYGYLAKNPHSRCIVCGAQGQNESRSEALAGRDYLAARGLDCERILLEDHSFNTVQNLRNAAELVDIQHDKVGIATNDYHVARSLAIARKAGFAHASGIAVKSYARFPLNNIVRESFAWAKDILAGSCV